MHRGCGGVEYSSHNWTNLNNDDDWWQGPRELGYTTCDVVFYWWEDDGGSSDYELSYAGFSLGVQMDDDDDKIGGVRLPYSAFAGAGADKWDPYEWDDLTQWTD
ncbi:hypothetical protein [Nocardioides stalactiti]|uniref:hypothetical protein n=1 Tax=Nocardioides stalactiti TaxID=2755356 RepID=UPI0016013BB2|nr:hypothetical protein [Nocardioides stalactiti]